MEIFRIFATGFILSLSLCLDIGIVNTAIINTAIRKNFLTAFLIGFGSCFGDLMYASLSITGLVVLFTYPVIRIIFWIGGNTFLIFLILTMIRRTINKEYLSPPVRRTFSNKPLKYFSTGLLLSITSPTTILWFISVGASVIASQNLTASKLSLLPFFAGFFIAGLVWSFFLSFLISTSKLFLGGQIVKYINCLSIIMLMILCCYSIISGAFYWAKR